MKIRRIRIFEFPVVIIFAVLFIYRFYGERYDFFQMRYLFSIILITLAAIKYYRYNNRQKYKIEVDITIRFMIPYFVILAWTLVQAVLVRADLHIAFTQLYRALITVAVPGSLFVLFGSDALGIVFSSMILTYSTTVVTGILSAGVDGFFEYLTSPTSKAINDVYAHYFEVHDLTFALGVFLIYYILFVKNKTISDKARIIISAAYIYMGYKRIELIAIILVYLFYLYASKKHINFKLRYAGILMLIAVSVYVFLSGSGILASIMMLFGIDTMGRIDFYNAMSKTFSFDLTYLGHGLGFVSNYLSDFSFGSQGTFVVTRLHNDLLTLYIELGFIPFAVWLYYYVIGQTKYFIYHYGNQIALLYFSLMVYLFITYATDNTVYYYMTQSSFCLIIISQCKKCFNIDIGELKGNWK